MRLLAAFLLIALLVASGASAAQAPYEIDVIMSLTGVPSPAGSFHVSKMRSAKVVNAPWNS